MAVRLELSRLDELRFGVRTAKAKVTTPEQLRDTLDACRSQSVRLAILRVPTWAYATVFAGEQAGARLMDTLCYYEHPRPQSVGFIECDVAFRLALPCDASLIESLARDAFADYDGHYGNDPRLRVEDVREVYPSWARSCCERTCASEPVFIASRGESAVGFAALRRSEGLELDVALLGVCRSDQRRGTASALLSYLVRSSAGLGAARLTYSTQITNIPMQRILARVGFLPTESVYTFHHWSDEAGL